MQKKRVLVTGGTGFIGSNVAKALFLAGRYEVVILDREIFERDNWRNYLGYEAELWDLDQFCFDGRDTSRMADEAADFIEKLGFFDAVIHLGANSNTQEKDTTHLLRFNTMFSRMLLGAFTAPESIGYDWKLPRGIHKAPARFIYASSAATYGAGELGFSEGRELDLKPLNAYAWSKSLFDNHLIRAGYFERYPIAGLKFFNVYGHNEGPKRHMASMVYQGLRQVRDSGEIRIFDGTLEMTRDFIHVDDTVAAILHLMEESPTATGIYNVGTGVATSWKQLADAVIKAAKDVWGVKGKLKKIPAPESLMRQYQKATVADIARLRGTGFSHEMMDIVEGARRVAERFVDHPVVDNDDY